MPPAYAIELRNLKSHVLVHPILHYLHEIVVPHVERSSCHIQLSILLVEHTVEVVNYQICKVQLVIGYGRLKLRVEVFVEREKEVRLVLYRLVHNIHLDLRFQALEEELVLCDLERAHLVQRYG